MKALIVAAGISSRMYPLTLNKPKPLLEIGDSTIIEHSIKNLKKYGIKDIAVVVGYLREQFFRTLGNRVKYIHNPFYKTTNDMASLWFGKGFLEDSDFLYLHGDLVYHPDLIERCLEKKGEIVLMVDRKRCDKEDMKVRVENGIVVESSKDISIEDAYGEWIGIAKISKNGGKILFNEMDRILGEERFNLYDTYAFTTLAQKGHRLNICHTNGLPWIEMDFVKEFKEAKNILKNEV